MEHVALGDFFLRKITVESVDFHTMESAKKNSRGENLELRNNKNQVIFFCFMVNNNKVLTAESHSPPFNENGWTIG